MSGSRSDSIENKFSEIKKLFAHSPICQSAKEIAAGVVTVPALAMVEIKRQKMVDKFKEKCRYKLFPNDKTSTSEAPSIKEKDFKPKSLFHPINMYRCVLIPIAEEFAFRGTLMPWLEKHGKRSGWKESHARTMSLAGSSLLFAAMHPKGARISAFTFGLFAGKLTQHFDESLTAATTAHMTWNTSLTILQNAVAKKASKK